MTISLEPQFTRKSYAFSAKYEILKDSRHMIRHEGRTLYRVKACRSFGHIKAGALGGYVETAANLSQDGDCWLSGDAKAYGAAVISGNARVQGLSEIFDHARVDGFAEIIGRSKVGGSAQIRGHAVIQGDVRILGTVCVMGQAHVSGNICLNGSMKIAGGDRIGTVNESRHARPQYA